RRSAQALFGVRRSDRCGLITQYLWRRARTIAHRSSASAAVQASDEEAAAFPVGFPAGGTQSRRRCFEPAMAGPMKHHRFFQEPPKLTLADVAEMTGAVLVDPARALVPIVGLAVLDEAGPSQLTFLENRRYAQQLATCHAAACFVSRRLEG